MFRLLHGLVHCHWALLWVLLSAAWTRLWNGLCQVWLWVRMHQAITQARDLLFTTRRNESNVWNTFVWSCPTRPSRWGMPISIDWPRLKSCQAVCDECMRGEIYSSLSRDAGCSAMWTWRELRVTKIWDSEHDHGFVLFLFATTSFHIARSGIFWTPTFVL